MVSRMWRFPDHVRLTALLLQLLKGTDSIQRMTSNIVYREVLQSFNYINIYMLIKYLMFFYLQITLTFTSTYIYNITINLNVIHVCALIKNSYNVKPTNTLLFIYLMIHLCFIYAILMLSTSLKMIKTCRNMSELRQMLCKKYNFNISAFVGYVVWINSKVCKRTQDLSNASLGQ
jgi:hypothetical protein